MASAVPKTVDELEDDELIAATRALHKNVGELKGLKRAGAHINGTNAKGQLVVTHVDVAESFARGKRAAYEAARTPESVSDPEPES